MSSLLITKSCHDQKGSCRISPSEKPSTHSGISRDERDVCGGGLLKVVGNEKEGGSGKWQMIDIGLGLW